VKLVREFGRAPSTISRAQRHQQPQLGEAQAADLEDADGARIGGGEGEEGLDGVGRHTRSILE
jgi:hypothetical protein